MSKYGSALGKLQAVQNAPEPEDRKPEFTNSGLLAVGPAEATIIEPQGPEREKYSTYLDGALVMRLKVYAATHRMKHHQVVEAALRAYLDEQ